MKVLISIHHADDDDPTVQEDDSMHRDIDALNDEMEAAGVRVMAKGLHRAIYAKSLWAQGGEVVTKDGPYLPTSEHMAGFWILDVSSMDEAMEWGKKAVVACRAPVEVRQFH